jgi:hypothetical protein
MRPAEGITKGFDFTVKGVFPSILERFAVSIKWAIKSVFESTLERIIKGIYFTVKGIPPSALEGLSVSINGS